MPFYPMTIVIGINHPKQVHMFRGLYFGLIAKGHNVIMLVVNKEICIQLLENYGMAYVLLGRNRKPRLAKVAQLVFTFIRTFIMCLKERPDVYVGQALPHLGLTKYLLGGRFLIFEDTEHAFWPQLLSVPFASKVVTSTYYKGDFGAKHIKLNGSFELAYLHPSVYRDEPDRLDSLGLKKDEVFTVLRFVSWTSNHDQGRTGLSYLSKIKAITEFEKYGRVFIFSENPLEFELAKYEIKLFGSAAHGLMKRATLVFGESASMAAEASCLGTPSIFIDDIPRGYASELSRYGLLYHFGESEYEQDLAIAKGVEILKSSGGDYTKRLDCFLSEKVNMSNEMLRIVLNED